MDVIAEYRLQLKYPDGKRVPVCLRLGRPVCRPTGIWECDGEVEGELSVNPARGEPFPAGGIGSTSWRALMAALRSVSNLLRMEVNHYEAMLRDETGRFPVHFDEVFPFPRDGERPPPG